MRQKGEERALVVGLASSSRGRWREAERLEELVALVRGAGVEVVERFLQVREKPDPAYYIGKGKAEEISRLAKEFGVNVLVVDADLSASQVRNLQRLTGLKVVDRTEVILDIFALHARTQEAKIQVELAQLEYQLSRLKGLGPALSRLGGGIGTRGPGEKMLETDRRRIAREIESLRRRLAEVERAKRVQRAKRKEAFKITLVGYTNAGKSSIMNALTHESLPVDDVPFTTLDATTRALKLPGVPVPVVLTDTVGFMEDLPHHLIASFRATLDVVREADLLLLVADISHPNLRHRLDTVAATLEELGAGDKPRVIVFNKVDLLLSDGPVGRMAREFPDAAFTSARTGEGIGKLVERIRERFTEHMRPFSVRVSVMDPKYHKILSVALITRHESLGEEVLLEGHIPPKYMGVLE